MLPEEIFTLRGYRKIVTARENIIAYFYMETMSCRVIVDVDYHETEKLNGFILQETMEQIEVFLRQQGLGQPEYLYIVSTYSESVGRELMMEIGAGRYWILDTYGHRFVLYPQDVSTEYKNVYDCMLRYIAEGEEAVRSTEGEKAKWFSRKALFGVNNLIILLNVLVFIWLEMQGSTMNSVFMLEHGVLYWPYVETFGQWYRVISSMFMHFGISHLFNNMLVLFFIGATLERAIGKRKYILLYLISGIAGNLISCWYYNVTAYPMMICGASGAIFGVVGGLLYIVIKNKGHYEDLSIRRMVLFVIMSVYSGYVSPQVNLAAHIGGLIAGFAMGFLLYRKNINGGTEAV